MTLRRNPAASASAAVATALLATIFAVAACGYRHEALYPVDVRTLAVPIFENRSFYRGIEFDLTEALIKQIELQTPYKVVAESGADTILAGSIVRVDQDVLSRSEEGGVPQELELRLVVNFEWSDARSGKILRSRQGLVAVGRYIPVRQVGQPLELAQHEAAQAMAASILAAMRSDW